MMSQQDADEIVQVVNAHGSSSLVLVCEHASPFIPSEFDNLGIGPEHLKSHAVWDPGAMDVARGLSDALDAAVVAAKVSRLVYDCNRPPGDQNAMPAKSEIVAVPGNAHVSAEDYAARVARYYAPFRAAVSNQIAQTENPILVTVHSFTPVYHGASRTVELGVLHDADARLASAMIDTAADHTTFAVECNQPYGPQDGVTHTLKEHGVSNGHLNVMLEVRNDLISTPRQQQEMVKMIGPWLENAFVQTQEKGVVKCWA